ncbi:hypothetical protein Btru_012150 [Bulinus truncatus]|nr:hypothetical protein Btru_012150 [Bulinus truncatus]
MAVLNILSDSWLTKIRLGLLGSLVVLSFFVISGVGAMTYKTEGTCPLFQLKHWSKGVCDFTLVVAILLQLIYCTIRFVPALLLFLGKIRSRAVFFAYSVQRCYILGELNFAIVIFVTAALLSAGVSSTCSSISCDQVDWFPAVQIAQVGAWLSSIIFVPLLVLDILALQRMTDEEEFSGETKVVYTATDSSLTQVGSTSGFSNPIQDVYPVEDGSSSNQPSV